MSQPPTSALATSFDWVTNPSGYDFTITYGGVTTGFHLATGTYMMFMGPSTPTGDLPGNAMEYIIGILNAFYGGTPTFSYSMNASTGRWTLSATNAFTMSPTYGNFDDVFGTMLSSGAASYTSQYQPYFLVLLASTVGNDWQELTPIAGATDEGGRVYAISSGLTRFTDELELSYIPANPTEQYVAGTVNTPWFPDDYFFPLKAWDPTVASPGNHYWSVAQHLLSSLGKVQTLARGNWFLVCQDAVTRYDVVTIPAEEVSTPRVSLQFTAWKRWRKWVTKINRLAVTTTGNRI